MSYVSGLSVVTVDRIIQDRKGLLANQSGYGASQAPDAGEASQDK